MTRLEGLQKIAASNPAALVPWEKTDEMIPVHKAIELVKAEEGFVEPEPTPEPEPMDHIEAGELEVDLETINKPDLDGLIEEEDDIEDMKDESDTDYSYN